MRKKEKTTTTTTPVSLPEANTVPIRVGAQATLLPTYEPYPQWLDRSGLPTTARIVYLAIYHRAISLSLQNRDQYVNDQGHLFVIYTNDDLAKNCTVTLSGVKAAKKILQEQGYITVEKIKGSNAIRIYPYYPESTQTYTFRNTFSKTGNKSNSSFDTDDFFEASLKKNLPPDVYEAYYNIHHT